MLAASLAALVIVAAGASAPPADANEVARGVRLYDEGEFDKAKDALLGQLETALPLELATAARIHLAASYFALNDLASARFQLLSMFKLDPTAELNHAKFAPRLLALADDARRDALAALAAASPTPPPPGPAEPPPVPQSPPTVSQTQPSAPLSALHFIPFGVGQFANGHKVKGTLFLVAEVLCFATSALSLSRVESLKQGGELFRSGRYLPADIGAARTFHAVYLGSFYVGAALVIGGLLDAALTRPLASGGVSLRGGGVSVAF